VGGGGGSKKGPDRVPWPEGTKLSGATRTFNITFRPRGRAEKGWERSSTCLATTSLTRFKKDAVSIRQTHRKAMRGGKGSKKFQNLRTKGTCLN